MILQIHECTAIQKYLEKGNVKGMNNSIKIQNIEHKKKEEEKKRNVREERNKM